MGRICVCGLDDMPDAVQKLRAGRLISLLPPAHQPHTPARIRNSDHLRLHVDDIDRPQDGHVAPAREHVGALIGFLRRAPPDVPLVIHCLAGMSRSPAAALVALVLDAPGREREAATMLRASAPVAIPNRLIIQLADESLQRAGALVAALDAMGEPDPFIDTEPFLLPRVLPPSAAG